MYIHVVVAVALGQNDDRKFFDDFLQSFVRRYTHIGIWHSVEGVSERERERES